MCADNRAVVTHVVKFIPQDAEEPEGELIPSDSGGTAGGFTDMIVGVGLGGQRSVSQLPVALLSPQLSEAAELHSAPPCATAWKVPPSERVAGDACLRDHHLGLHLPAF